MDNITILWQSKRKIIYLGLFFYILYFIFGIFFCWFCWFVLLKETLWYVLLALGLNIFYAFESYKALNFQSMLLTEKGLLVKTRFNGDIFYSYGDFVINYSIAVGIRFFERIEICDTKHQEKSFIFPCGVDSLGSFKNNQKFKELCTQYTQQALESMNLQERVNLYKLYQSNIEYIFNNEINHNVFTIDFTPYMQEMKSYLKDKK